MSYSYWSVGMIFGLGRHNFRLGLGFWRESWFWVWWFRLGYFGVREGFTQTELQFWEMQSKVGLKATTHVREKFCNFVCNKTRFSCIFINSRFSYSRKCNEFLWLIKNLPGFQDISRFNEFSQNLKTRVPPASPLPYLVYKGMSHTFDILQISFFKIFCFLEVLSLWVFSVEVFRIFRNFNF